MASNLEEKTEYSVEEQLQLLLQEAGLESVPIDPSSLEALKVFVAKDDYNVNVSVSNELADGVNNNSNSHPPVSNVEPHPELKRFTSELTVPSADSFCSKGEESSIAVAGSFVHLEGASPVENQILEQLHRQTRLLLDMQRRIDELTSTVEYLSTSGGGIGGAGTGINSGNNTASAAPRRFYSRVTAPIIAKPQTKTPAPGTSSGISPSSAQQPTATVPRPAAPVGPRGAAPNNNQNNNNDQQGGVVGFIKKSFLFKVGLVFLTLRRRYGVQELDGGLIFKVLFMMAILMARMSSSSKRFNDTEWHTKFAVLTTIVLVGFLAQTGYLKYLYIFLVKENFAGRIWRGEDANAMIQNPAPVVAGGPNGNNDNNNNNNNEGPALPRGQFPPNHQQPGQAGNNNNNGAAADNGWRNTFLGGMIPQADQGGVAGAVQNVALVLGSFLMSIFPMWQPEGPPVPRQPPQPRPPQPAVEGFGGVAAGPGEVRPPRDPVQAVDDSDDDDDDLTE